MSQRNRIIYRSRVFNRFPELNGGGYIEPVSGRLRRADMLTALKRGRKVQYRLLETWQCGYFDTDLYATR
jgi:hypothetical protein